MVFDIYRPHIKVYHWSDEKADWEFWRSVTIMTFDPMRDEDSVTEMPPPGRERRRVVSGGSLPVCTIEARGASMVDLDGLKRLVFEDDPKHKIDAYNAYLHAWYQKGRMRFVGPAHNP